MEDFVHLHVHTQYSILDGQASISALVDKAIGNKMRGMAVTDHGNMMGIKEFYNYAQKVIGKAKGALAAAKAELDALHAPDCALSPEERAAKEEELTKTIEKQQRIADFKPIFGCEAYVARRGDKTLREGKQDQSGWHLILLAKNEKGYHNLVKIVSRSWVDGFYMRPRTDHKDLETYSEGIICCSACLGGEIPQKILKGRIEEAEEAVQWFKRVFGDDYYLELQRHKVTDPSINANRETYPLQEQVNKELLTLAAKYGVKTICSNDCHFVNEENAEAHDRLICLSTGKDLNDPSRMLYTKQEWFKTREEMNAVFADLPETLRNTCEICDKIETYSIDHAPIMPNFAIPEDFGTEEQYRQRLTEEQLYDEFTQDENGNVVMSREEGLSKIKKLGGFDKLYRIKLEADYLAKLAYEGAKKRYGDPLDEETSERIKFELHIMKTMGFPGYFLIVQDFIRAAREELDVSVGPGRGSAAGSCVAYCLGITQIDPIKYDLLFERFLNPDRISLPDIDVDFDDDGRGRVLNWVTKKYGEDNVAHIITYGTMATKLALKDVARVQKLPLDVSNRLCKLIPDKLPEGPDGKAPKLNLKNAIAAIPELREAECSPDPVMRDTLRYAKMLEGNVRNTGVHACGFIICRDNISDWVPVSTAEDKDTGEKVQCTQYEGKVIEETGLIKMDFLGLKTLSIIKEALENIRESLGIELDIDRIPIDDPATYQLFCDGRTIGTFQFESAGMQKYLRELQPSTFEDLIAMNALYRPGPMAYIPQFIARKHGDEPIVYDLPCMEKYLKDTYGITVYQEQVMLLSRLIANFTRGESDALRKAMGKKLIEKLNHMYPKFISGGKANGHDEKVLEKIWDDWRAFASYAFNKSHATCYSWVAYQTAYLKANYPAQYMAGNMSRNLSNINEIMKLMDESKSMGIRTLGPDINESHAKFSVNHEGNIRFGLAAVKGVGESAVECIIKERNENGPYKSVFDLVERVNLSACNRKCLENLALAGAFDSFETMKREQFFAKNSRGEVFMDTLLRYGVRYQQDLVTSQNSLFGATDMAEATKPEIPEEYEQWSALERLNRERELISVYISGHPLDDYSIILTDVCSNHAPDLADISPY
ncbi:MAG: DNA polymerase III subunit alpha, partial [Bacteroidales bacterium]